MNVTSNEAEQSSCTTCQHLNFRGLFQQLDIKPWTQEADKSGEEDSKYWLSLGYLDDIAKRKSCAFCRLIIQSLCACHSGPSLTSEGLLITKTPDDGRLRCRLGIHVAGVVRLPKGKERKAIVLHINVDKATPVNISGLRFSHGEIMLAAEDAISAGVDPMYHGRLLKECVDINLIRGWIDYCKDNHTTTCNFTPWEKVRQFPQGLRLVDVKRMCVVRVQSHARYVALSYVWGSAKIYQLTTNNVLSMEKEFSLSKRIDILGQTLLDALELTQRLGEKYLWCDQLCIVQDDSKEKVGQISQMGLIYAQALLTIVAAGGSNSNAPLPGLRPGSRLVNQHTEVINGLRLIVPLPTLSRQLSNSTWNTRAWTFQERILSRRCLIFTNRQVYFDCRCDAMREDIVCERITSDKTQDPSYHSYTQDSGGLTLFPKATSLPEGPIAQDLKPGSKRWPKTLTTYSQLIELYSSKNLSYPQDILLAFEGAQAVLKKLNGWSFLYGLPEPIWDHALLWRPKDVIHRRSFNGESTAGQQPVPPTYSWAAWTGPVSYRPWDFGLESRIDQFEVRRDHYFKVIKRKRQTGCAEPGNTIYEYNPPILSKPTVSRRPQDSTAALPSERTQDLVKDASTKSPATTIEWLQFWASVVSFSCFNIQPDRSAGRPSVSVNDLVGVDDNTQPGIADLKPRMWMYSQDGRKVCFLWHLPLMDTQDETRELVLLSQSHSQDPADDLSSIDLGEVGYYEGCMLNVMLVQWRGEFAERVTVGRIHDRDWNAAGPQRKLIQLV